MNTTDYELNQTEKQVALRDWVLRGEPNVFATFTFHADESVGLAYAKKKFGTFAHAYKKSLFGERSRKKIFMVPVVEGALGGLYRESGDSSKHTHIHCLMKLAGNPLIHKDTIAKLWRESGGFCGDPRVYCPGYEDWFIVLDGAEKQRSFANYLFKTCRSRADAVLVDFIPEFAT